MSLNSLFQTVYDGYTGTTSAGKAITVSIIISVISAVFNLFAMRRGALLVKDEKQQSLWKDFKSFPQITFDFILMPPRRVWDLFRRGYYFQSIVTALVTGVGLGLIVGFIRGKTNWGIITGVSSLAFIVLAALVIEFFNARKFAEAEAE